MTSRPRKRPVYPSSRWRKAGRRIPLRAGKRSAFSRKSEMDHLKNLNDEQKRAVTEGDGAVLVVAGPGSGKTRTIISRICHQLDKGVPPERILLLTFTNKAAAEMKRRSLELAGDGAGRIMA